MLTKPVMDKDTLSRLVTEKLAKHFDVKPQEASDNLFYKALALVLVDILREKQSRFAAKAAAQGQKQVYYLSMEFLMGRSLKNSLYNLGLENVARDVMHGYGVSLDALYECEPDAGLGNGGLGRLAACFLDSLATLDIPASGYSICYEYGIFKQKLVDGWQNELPDNWLPGGSVWLTPAPAHTVDVRFEGTIKEFWDENYHHVSHEGYHVVKAVPYDMYVSGFQSEGVSRLRLYKAETSAFDMERFNNGDYAGAFGQMNTSEAISKLLYPNDNHLEGKVLRLKQQYFLCAAAIADIVYHHMTEYPTPENLHEKVAIHINDTHPTLAIPELMRVLLDDCGYGWDKAWDIVTHTFAYTNHTVMNEALEKWDKELMHRLLPRIYSIIQEIDNRYRRRVWEETGDAGKVERMAVISGGQVRMANLCVIASQSVNGVSKLHSQIIKDDLFHDYYCQEPQKFHNVTNGIAYRRWLYQANPRLTALVEQCIGDGFLKNAGELAKLRSFAGDEGVLRDLAAVKRANKQDLANYIYKKQGLSIDPGTIFDVQVKRLHEYKRQQMNALHILTQYRYLLENPNADFVPRTYIFAAKAAPGYYMAKKIIKLIWAIGEEIKRHPRIRNLLSIAYLEDYSVTMSEHLMPASEISEQISLAGTEASGTGNMKLMLSGAVTLGTLDGANLEILDAVGEENFISFGMTEQQVSQLRRQGYHPEEIYRNDEVIRGALDMMTSGVGGCQFEDVAGALRSVDYYMALADFASYSEAQRRAADIYRNTGQFSRMSLMNIAGAGIFSADRAIADYARDIWRLPGRTDA